MCQKENEITFDAYILALTASLEGCLKLQSLSYLMLHVSEIIPPILCFLRTTKPFICVSRERND